MPSNCNIKRVILLSVILSSLCVFHAFSEIYTSPDGHQFTECSICKGEGVAPCIGCAGNGGYYIGYNFVYCPMCGGKGIVTCIMCNGLGLVPYHERNSSSSGSGMYNGGYGGYSGGGYSGSSSSSGSIRCSGCGGTAKCTAYGVAGDRNEDVGY